MSVMLKGMTWSHPRGYDPMVACSASWAQMTGVDVSWEKRSLQDFESFPVEELARQYDLIVIDHPHVGQITKESCVLPLDVSGREAVCSRLAAGSVGPSYRSYSWEGRQWAFPIDAATQVQAFVPDRIARPVTTFAEALELGRAGRLALPLRPPHALMTFYTLAAHLGYACGTDADHFIAPAAGQEVWGRLQELARLVDPGDLTRDPVEVFERMAEPDSAIACVPYIYGYVSYACEGFRPTRIHFADIPAIDGRGPVGAALGGTGIAVSAKTRHPAEAIEFAYWIASADAQRGPYAKAGGQPGHAAAWEDAGVNAASAGFYERTRETLERSYVRPRHDGYMGFQGAASDRISEALAGKEHEWHALHRDIERLWADSDPGNGRPGS